MKKMLALVLCAVLLLSLAVPSLAAEQGHFVLTVVSANAVIVEPTYISYTHGQTVREALLASEHSFSGLEQGFIYAVDGVSANYILFYDGNGYDLTASAESITALCVGVSSQYSAELIELIGEMGAFREMEHIGNYPPAQAAYESGLTAIRNGDAATAKAALEQLNQAISDYETMLNGTKYTVSVRAMQADTSLTAPQVILTDAYGNRTVVTGTSLQVVAGTYSFSVSDGGYNRTDGSITVSGDTYLEVTLPSGDWFGAVKLLNSEKEPFPYTQNRDDHTAVYRIPDVTREVGSIYLNVEQGAVPNRDTTKLRTIYTGTNQYDYSGINRSWESTATALIYLVKQGMDDASLRLEAQYKDERGHTQIQSYALSVQRTPTLSSLTVTADGTVHPIDYNPTTYRYTVTTVSDTLDIDGAAFDAAYEIEGTGSVPSEGSAVVTVSARNRSTQYILEIEKKDSVPVILTVPAGVTAWVENSAGSRIEPVDGVYHLIPGEAYTYHTTKARHYHTVYEFVAQAGLRLTAAEPIAEDWLSDLALYNGGNATTRVEYEADKTFSAALHSYTFTVSDCNTSLYMQADSEHTVTALYTTQTTNAATNGISREITVNTAVSDTGTAKIMTQAIARSGYSNIITLRISRTEKGITYYQDYVLNLVKKLHLSALKVENGEGELTLLDNSGNVCDFNRDITDYRICVDRGETTLRLTGTFPNTSDTTNCCGGYNAMVNGTSYDTLENVTLSLTPERDEETVILQVRHGDSKAVATEYVLTIEKSDPVAVTFAVTPKDAVVYMVNDLNGKRVTGEQGIYMLTPGSTYSYTVTCKGYQGISGVYTAPYTAETVTITLEKAAVNTSLQQLPSAWPHLRQNSDNNGVISARTPTKDDEAVLYWATKIGEGFDKNACGCPILVDGYLYTYAGTTIYKVDTVSGEIVATGTMDHASSFAINPPTYADGMLFIGLADGTVQAFNAATMESLWIYHDPLGGQPNCSISYHNGYVYTGFWVGETSQANYVCLSATDEDPTCAREEKLATWRYSSLGGFYWAGAYVCDDFLLVGTDDGDSGYTNGKARLLSIDPLSGVLLDEMTMEVVGDIRSSITAYNGKYYFTNKGGYFFEATVGTEGNIEGVRTLRLYNYANRDAAPPMSTCTPTIYNGRAYIGVSGTSQFGAYSGHNITVIDIPNWEIAYTVRTQGYPQTSGVLTTAYEKSNGYVYVYFFDNYTPGKLRVLQDRPGQTKASLVTTETYVDKGVTKTYETAYALFTPNGDQAQYALCSPIVDEYGTLYFKNDSAYLMAVGSTVEKLEITQQPERLTYQAGETFCGTGMKVTARYSNGTSRDVTDYVTWSDEPLTAQDTDFVITLPYVMYQNLAGVAGTDCQEPFVALRLTIGSDVSYGDVNGDGNIDMVDVSRILLYINGMGQLTDSQLAAAEVTGDGTVSMIDVSILLQYINGTIGTFPVQSVQ